MARADEELRAAEHLLAHGFARIALTRAYFAAFHAVRALLYARGHEPRTHRGAISLFGQHFVKHGTYPAADGWLLSRLQRFREEADYSDAFVADPALARQELDAARDLVRRIAADLAPPTPDQQQ
jgi:uncharacterized protein (UPF0332 family)